MQNQNYKNHYRYLFFYTVILLLIVVACLAGSVYNLYNAYHFNRGRTQAGLLVGLSTALVFFYVYVRQFPNKVQDRAIRAEENFRHFVLTGKPLDSRLRLSQIIALRFAADTEFLILAKRAVDENMSPSAIKKAIVNWRGDYHRA